MEFMEIKFLILIIGFCVIGDAVVQADQSSPHGVDKVIKTYVAYANVMKNRFELEKEQIEKNLEIKLNSSINEYQNQLNVSYHRLSTLLNEVRKVPKNEQRINALNSSVQNAYLEHFPEYVITVKELTRNKTNPLMEIVSEEIQKLAKNIEELQHFLQLCFPQLHNSKKCSIEEGTQLVENTNTTIGLIKDFLVSVSMLVTDIGNDSIELFKNIGQMTTAIEDYLTLQIHQCTEKINLFQ